MMKKLVTPVRNNEEIKLTFLEVLFLAFCMCPFVFPNPIVVTNIQPYAAIFGTLILFRELLKSGTKSRLFSEKFNIISAFTLVLAMVFVFINGLNISALRALYNYYAVAVIPAATVLVLKRVKSYPEKMIKLMILFWFVVSTIQFFIYRGFLTQLIGGVRWSSGYRGVVGLASEPSFFGIACFYFLHMIRRFKQHKAQYMVLVLAMGVIYAQSMMGLLFLVAFVGVYLIEMSRSWKGLVYWGLALVALFVFAKLLNTVFEGTRMSELLNTFLNGGLEALFNDASADNRLESIVEALSLFWENKMLPAGFGGRIGSGYGGFLCELGIFALPILIAISGVLSGTFDRKISRILYFVLVTLLLFNNTQLGNPFLLFVVGTNVFFAKAQENDLAVKAPVEKKKKLKHV